MTTDPTPTSPAPPNQPTQRDTEPASRRGGGMRIFKWIVLVILLLLIVVGIVVYVNLNSIVRRTVEKQSASSLNVPTELESATVSLFGGTVSLSNFKVGQPQGFVSPQLMSLGGIDVGVKVNELRQDPLRVNQITIRDPKLLIEMKGTDFNIKKFIDQLPAGEDKPVDGEEPMQLIINNLKVQGAQVTFRPDVSALSSLPGIGEQLKGVKQEYVLSIPPLEMQNIGTGEGNQNGAEIKEVVTLLVQELAAKATESESLPPELRQVLKLNVDDLTAMAKQKLGEEINKQLDRVSEELKGKIPGEAGKAVEGILKDPGAAVKDPGKALEKGLGDLLGGQKKSQPVPPATQPK